MLAPLPPRFARSPLPAIAGREGDASLFDIADRQFRAHRGAGGAPAQRSASLPKQDWHASMARYAASIAAVSIGISASCSNRRWR